MVLSSGTRFGPYQIVAPLGAGGMGEVYRACDSRLGREVAVKILSPAFSADADRRRRFEQEARAAAALNHPNICTIYEIGDIDGTHFIAMELVEGHTLRVLLPPRGFDLPKLLEYGIQIVDALAKAHELGITHRDIKPENILVSRDGLVKVADFGLAKLADPSSRGAAGLSSEDVTQSRVVLGTAHYMSPEQAQGQNVDARSDVFSVGLLFFELATGSPAFRGRNSIDVLHAVVHDPLSSHDLTKLGLPDEFVRLIEKATEKNRDQRYSSSREIAVDLRRLQHHLQQQSSDAVAPRRSHRHPLYVFVGSLLVVSLATAWSFRDRLWPPTPDVAALADVPTQTDRLVVLPFENLTHQSADDWLSGALSDSLTFGLRNVTSVILVNREPVTELYRRELIREPDPLTSQIIRRLTELLRVRYYVHGSYQKVGEQIRVVATLVDTTDTTIKAQQALTDRFANIFQIQDELTNRFANALETGARLDPVTETPSLDAYRLYSEARMAYAASTRSYAEARQKLQEAVALDPKYAQAWALLGKLDARLAAPATFSGTSLSDLRAEALTAARRAIALNPSLYDANIAVALASRENGNNVEWRSRAEIAISMNPRMAEAYAILADWYSLTPAWGCGDRTVNTNLAEGHYRRALRIEPRFGPAYTNLANHLLWADRVPEALQVTEDGLALLPNYVSLRAQRGNGLLRLNRVAEAVLVLEPLDRMRTPSASDLQILSFLDIRQGSVARAKNRLGTPEAWSSANLLGVAANYLDAGYPDEGVPLLNRARTVDPACTRQVIDTPRFLRHRSIPAVAALLAKFTNR